jgi:alcohol dehydrogenase
MKALVLQRTSKSNWEEKPKLAIKNPTDAIIRITKTTISEIDICIKNRDVPEVMENLIIMLDGVLLADEVEQSVSILNVANKALISYHILRN